MLRRIDAVLGVGGVGKTTFIYRALGIQLRIRVTLRAGVYAVRLGDVVYEVVDVPGQLAVEVAENFARMWKFYVDRAIYMYDVTDRSSLDALLKIHNALLSWGIRPAREIVVVGNKVDLAKEVGVFVDAGEAAKKVGASEVHYISAYYDSPEKLLSLL